MSTAPSTKKSDRIQNTVAVAIVGIGIMVSSFGFAQAAELRPGSRPGHCRHQRAGPCVQRLHRGRRPRSLNRDSKGRTGKIPARPFLLTSIVSLL